jgi:hypothetical protein
MLQAIFQQSVTKKKSLIIFTVGVYVIFFSFLMLQLSKVEHLSLARLLLGSL